MKWWSKFVTHQKMVIVALMVHRDAFPNGLILTIHTAESVEKFLPEYIICQYACVKFPMNDQGIEFINRMFAAAHQLQGYAIVERQYLTIEYAFIKSIEDLRSSANHFKCAICVRKCFKFYRQLVSYTSSSSAEHSYCNRFGNDQSLSRKIDVLRTVWIFELLPMLEKDIFYRNLHESTKVSSQKTTSISYIFIKRKYSISSHFLKHKNQFI